MSEPHLVEQIVDEVEDATNGSVPNDVADLVNDIKVHMLIS